MPVTIQVTPAAGPIGTRTFNVHINMYHNSLALDPGSFYVTWNSVDVTSQFSASFSGGTGNADGTLALTAGSSSTLQASIDTNDGFTTTQSFIYTSTLPPDPVVEVTPAAEPRGVSPSATVTERFLITNTRDTARTFNLARACSGAVLSCGAPSVAQVSLAGKASAEATVTYSVSGTPDATGTLTLTATDAAESSNTNTGSISVRVSQPPVADLPATAPLHRIERGLCLTLNAGSDGAVECGDLRLAHDMPGVVTHNTARAPTLLYNSQHAHPYVLVPLNVTVPTTLPANVTATLSVGGTQRATGSWSGSDWGTAGSTRRIVLGFDALDSPTLATGVYTYTIVARRESAGDVLESVSGELVVVNRSASPYGAGWWVAGVEQMLSISSNRLLWIGGDGSTRIYSPTGISNKWAASGLTRPDTVTSDGTNYFRHLLQKTRVRFNASGQHVATINRLGDSTAFGYVSTALSSTLTQITVPGGLQLTFTRVNPGTDDRLASITVPGDPTSRTTTLNRSGDRILSITDPTSLAVTFGYSGASNRIRTRTNRRNHLTSYEFDGAGKVIEVEVDMGPSEPAIVTTFRALESRGLPGGAFGPAVAPANAYAMIDGPRSDVADSTLFWLDGYGAPRRIRNALGLETILTRGDAAWPALVTETRSPMGYIQQATYDARGNIASSTAVNPLGNSVNATTQFAWDSGWDLVTQITPPIGEPTTFAYDNSLGYPVWQQVGNSSARRVNFLHNTGGRLVAVQAPLTARDSIVYGALGNIDSVRSTTGVWVQSYKDAIGRDTLVVSPIEGTAVLRSRSSYDLMGRLSETMSVGPDMSVTGCTECSGRAVPAETLAVSTTYDEEGNVTAVNREATPSVTGVGMVTTEYEYDRAHRRIREQNFQASERWSYDPAGNAVTTITRRGDTLRTRYDALGRLLRHAVPRIEHASLVCTTTSTMPCPPLNPTFDAFIVHADTARYTFDADGRMLAADNGDARVRRTYYRGGLLATDTLALRRYDRLSYAAHVYGLQFTYDQLGRRTTLVHPGNLAASAQTVYDYADWGPIETITATFGAGASYLYTFGFDAAGRPSTLAMPGSRTSTLTYDAGGQLVKRALPLLFDDSLQYDLQSKFRQVDMRQTSETFRTWYSGLGHVVATRWDKGNGIQVDEYRMDAHGNVSWAWQRDPLAIDSVSSTYSTAGRLMSMTGTGSSGTGTRSDAWRDYDAAGNNTRSTDDVVLPGSNTRSSSRYYYGADQRLRFLQVLGTGGVTARKQEFRYDALGRRVLLRTQLPNCSGTCPAAIERFVWDGDELLYELRAPDGSAAALETAWGTGAQYGKVAYVHGLEIDQPIGLYRSSYVSGSNNLFLVPHANWRGHFQTGTDSAGVVCCTAIDWPAPKMRTYMEAGAIAGDWMGSLVQDQRDMSGLMYRRNRYYDSNTGRFTQEDPIGLAGGLNLYGFANGDPVNFSDPFGLCPKSAGGDGATDNYSDCLKGTSGYYAYRATQGDSSVANTILGWGATCGESETCMAGAEILATFVGGKVLDGILESGQYLRAGIRTYRGQRELRVSGKLLDSFTGEKGTHWTSAKVLKALKELMK